jgi:membrane protein implicated in regulation of membrane protease activity
MMDWNQLFTPQVIWVVIGLIMLIEEFVVPGLVVFFFGLGALLVGITCISIDLSLNAQIGLFLGSSLTMLVTLRHWSTQVFQGRRTAARVDAADTDEIIGARAKAVRVISPDAEGRVELHGTDWQATAEEVIPAGSAVIVVARDNLTLVVKSVS